MGCWSVMYYLRVTVIFTLTSDLVFRINVSGAYLLYYFKLKFGVWTHLEMLKCHVLFMGHC